MRSQIRSVAVAALAFVFFSCAENSVTGPEFDTVHKTASAAAPTAFLISQVYGGGGGSGTTASFQRDFVELHNVTNAAVNILNWKVGYASAGGTSWNVATLPSFSVLAGGFATIAMGTTGTGGAPLPSFQGTGSADMAQGAGKVILLSPGTTNPTGACPASGTYADYVAYGTTSTNCNGLGTTSNTAVNTAVIRSGNACTYTPLMSDFAVGTPNPRGGTAASFICADQPPPPPPPTQVVTTVSVSTATSSVQTGDKPQFTAKAFDGATPPVEMTGITFTWSSSNTSIATVDAAGLVTTLTAGDVLIAAKAPNNVTGTASLHIVEPPPPPPPADVVISQVFGGGGNSGAVLLNDYIELYNHGNAPVDLGGWSVQLASSAATSWTVTPLSGVIQPGKYYLVQEAAGGNTLATPLPTPDAIGTLAMSGINAKVILVRGTAAQSGACPASAIVNDRVAYGLPGTSNDCVATWGTQLGFNLTNTTAQWRNNDGCDNTQIVANDFSILTADPRNSASPAKTCGQPVRSQSSATVVINELLSDPVNSQASSGQWFEVFNYGSSPVDLQGWAIVSGGSSQPNHTIASSVVVPAGGYAVLGRSSSQAFNGGAPVNYSYYVGSTKTIWLDAKDFLMLVDNTNARVDSVAWTSMPHGVSVGVRNAASDNSDANGPNWGYATNTFGQGDFGTPGDNNEPLANTPPAVSTNHITISGRVPTDAPLPVGFEAQIFATEFNQSNVQVVTTPPLTFTWSSLTPSIASVDPVTGVIHSLSPGTATFRVTSSDGTVKNHSLVMEAGTLGNAQYGNNTEFGDPVDNDPSNDEIVRRPQFTSSYNQFKGQPNWVSYDLNGTQFVSGTDRCNCFTHDPLLPSNFPHLSTADYTGGGSFAAAGRNDGVNYGIDRGHMTRSSDRTTGTIDNADTYYLSNVVPQFADLNQGPWNVMEGDLHAMAATGTKEIYIITGPAGINTTTTLGSNGTVKNEGKIQIPASTWKIAVIMPRGQGLANVHSASDVQVIAVNMPNRPGVRNEDWHQWETTVNAIEQLTGYNFLMALPDNIEAVVEGRTRAPISQPGGPYTAVEGSSVAFDGSASSDPDGDALTYAWQYGDGSTGSGVSAPHTYADNGSFSAILTVTDPSGANDVTNAPVTITNASPVVDAGADGTIRANETFTLNGSFSDAGRNDSPWNYSIIWGDGATSNGTRTSQGSFSSSHTYATAASYAVSVTFTDKDGGVGSDNLALTVKPLLAPTAAVDGPFTSSEGGAVAMSAAGSSDADGSVVSYAWNFGDGSSGTGASVSHTYAQDGDYTVSLTATDNDGLTGSTTTTAHVNNVAPVVSSIAGATILAAGTYTAAGSFTDPGNDAWTATVDYGDGSSVAPLSLSGKTFSLSHAYPTAGTFNVKVTVSDDHSAISTAAVIVVQGKPTAVSDGPYTSAEGGAVAMSAGGSSDADGTIASYAWNFGDGATGSGATASHVYAQDGDYTVAIVVTDNDGLQSSTTTTAHISNVAPLIAPISNSSVKPAAVYTAPGSFADPGADSWSATVDYGDGTGASQLPLSGKTFSLSHGYGAAGIYSVTITVTDGQASGTATHTVSVLAAPIASAAASSGASEGAPVSFSSAGSNDSDGSIVSYAWTFGDGSTGTGASPAHVYAQDGDYSFSLTVMDNDGLTGTRSGSVHIANVAPAIAAIGNAVLASGSYVTSGSFSDPGADTWTASVDYGDGSGVLPLSLSGTGFTLTHTFTAGKTYTVTVTVSDGDATSTSTHTVRVTSRPVANAAGPYTSNEGSPVSLSGSASDDVDGSVEAYSWTFGDGGSSTATNPTHTYLQDGDYTITLTVTDNDNLTGTTTTTVHVANVAPVLSPVSGMTLVAGATYSASGSLTDPGADTWTATVDYGDGSGVQTLSLAGKSFSLSHLYPAAGHFTVYVTVSDDHSSATTTAAVIVQAKPTASVGGPYSTMEGSSVDLSGAGSSDADGSIASYAWNFGDGSSGTGASPTHMYTQDGDFTVTLVVTDNDGLTATATGSVHVANSAPTIKTLGNVIQSAGSYSATGSFTDSGADSWAATVNYGDGSGVAPLTLSGKNFTLAHTFAAGKTYTVTVTVSDDDATSTSTHTVRITANPVANAGGPYSSSEGSSVAMSGSASTDIDGTVVSYAWSFGDGATGTGANVSHTYAQDGNYTVTLTVTDNEGFTATTTTTVQVANVSATIRTFAGATLLPAETYSASGSFADPGADTWSAMVNYGDGSGTSALALSGKNFSLIHKYNAAGIFTVTVTVNDGGSISTATQTVTVLTPLAGANSALALLNQLVAQGKVTDANAKNTRNRLESAQKQIEKDNANSSSAKALLTGALNELDKAIANGDISAANAAELRAMIVRLIATP